MAVVLTAVTIIGNLYFTVNTVETSSEQVVRISEENLDNDQLMICISTTMDQVASRSGEDLDNDLLIARSYGYEDLLVFTYVPSTPEQKIDLYADYKIKEDGTTLAAGKHRPYEDVSVDKPITFEVQRKPSSVYELDISVEDTDGNLVHKSNMKIGLKNNYTYS